MNGRRFKAVIGIVCVLLNMAVILHAGHGAVLCVAHDHVAIESAFRGGCCGSAETGHHAGQSAIASRTNAPADNPISCGPCMDIPLASEFLASASHTPKVPAKLALEMKPIFLAPPTDAPVVLADSGTHSPPLPQNFEILRI